MCVCVCDRERERLCLATGASNGRWFCSIKHYTAWLHHEEEGNFKEQSGEQGVHV